MKMGRQLSVMKADLKEWFGLLAAGAVTLTVLGGVTYGRNLIPDFTNKSRSNQGIEAVVHEKDSNSLEKQVAFSEQRYSHSEPRYSGLSRNKDKAYSFKNLTKDYKKAMHVLGNRRVKIERALSKRTDTNFGNNADAIHPIIEGILDWKEYRERHNSSGRYQRRRAVEHGIDALSVPALNALDDKVEAKMDEIEARYGTCTEIHRMDYKLAAELQRIIEEGSRRISTYRRR